MTTGRINQVMNCILKVPVSEEARDRQDSIWSSSIQELHTTQKGCELKSYFLWVNTVP